MYLTVGKNTVLTEESILGIFDLDNCSQSRQTREFLAAEEKRSRIRNIAEDIPNTFLLCEEGTYLIQTASRNLAKRLK